MEFVKIVLLSVLAAICYGIVHDQITARVCIEYFTIGHPKIIESTSPTMLGLAWGIVATWWVGLPLGILLATCARFGTRARVRARVLVPRLTALMAVVLVLALSTGAVVDVLAKAGRMRISPDWAILLPPEARIPFLMDLWTHTASYFLGTLGGLYLAVMTYRHRLLSEDN